MSENITGRRPGRPPSATPKRQGRLLSANITLEARAALEAEAARTGRSVSQVAELWLETARSMPQDLRGLMMEMASVRDRIVGRMGDPAESRVASDAIRGSWVALVNDAAPRGPRTTEEQLVQVKITEYFGPADRLADEVETLVNAGAQDEGVRILTDKSITYGGGYVRPLRLLRYRASDLDWFVVRLLIDPLNEAAAASPRLAPYTNAVCDALWEVQKAQRAADLVAEGVGAQAAEIVRETAAPK
jgi:hypothetical protein